jgi:tetratricopeptide (TPR) repeat protein
VPEIVRPAPAPPRPAPKRPQIATVADRPRTEEPDRRSLGLGWLVIGVVLGLAGAGSYFYFVGNEGSSRSVVEHVRAGNHFARGADYGRAVAEYQAALKLDPANAIAHRNLAAAHALLGQVDLAAAEYQAYLRVAPNAPDADAVRRVLGSDGAPPAPGGRK